MIITLASGLLLFWAEYTDLERVLCQRNFDTANKGATGRRTTISQLVFIIVIINVVDRKSMYGLELLGNFFDAGRLFFLGGMLIFAWKFLKGLSDGFSGIIRIRERWEVSAASSE